VKSILFVLPAAVLCCALRLPAQNGNKVAVINVQSALVSTKEGQKAAGEIQARFNPKKGELEKRQTEIGQLQDQLNRGRNTLSDDARQNLVREIDQKTKSLNRDTEDAQAELNQDEQKIMGELLGRLMQVVNKYAKDNGYVLVLDVSSQQTPVMYASNTIEITKEIVELYDKNTAPASPGAAAAPGVTKPPAAAAPKPSAPPK
jgi:outer membrane protein